MDRMHQKRNPSCHRHSSDALTRSKGGVENGRPQGKESKGKAKKIAQSNPKRPRFTPLTNLLASSEKVVVEFTDNKGKGKTTPLQSKPKRQRFRSLREILASSEEAVESRKVVEFTGNKSKGKSTPLQSKPKRQRFRSLREILTSSEEAVESKKVVVEFTGNKGKGKTTPLQSKPKRQRFKSLTEILALSSEEEEADIPDVQGQGEIMLQSTSKRPRFVSLTDVESKKRLKLSPLREFPCDQLQDGATDSNHPVPHGGDHDGDLGVPVHVADEASRTAYPDDFPVHAEGIGIDIPTTRLTAAASFNTYCLDNYPSCGSCIETATLPPMVEHVDLCTPRFNHAFDTTYNQATQLNVTNGVHDVAAHRRGGNGAYRFSFCELLTLGMTSDEGEDQNSAAVLERQKKLDAALMWECDDGDDVCYCF